MNLRLANLRGANLRATNLRGADLSGANLQGADLIQANLIDASLADSDLIEANLSGATVGGANFSSAKMGGTRLQDLDLSEAIGLETVSHAGASTTGASTINRSGSQVPESFLRGSGYVPDPIVAHPARRVVVAGAAMVPDLLRDDVTRFPKVYFLMDLVGHQVVILAVALSVRLFHLAISWLEVHLPLHNLPEELRPYSSISLTRSIVTVMDTVAVLMAVLVAIGDLWKLCRETWRSVLND
ncbi:MAG: pentapeptide repeat-containing protein [Acidobacteriia bacterium]|nr:pentapeptide repeat-containing protein [Terriglobia bacterium]